MLGENLTILQMNDSHAYLDIHQELFWEGDHAKYELAGGYARIATIFNQIREENPITHWLLIVEILFMELMQQ